MFELFNGATQGERYQNGVLHYLERICKALEENKEVNIDKEDVPNSFYGESEVEQIKEVIDKPKKRTRKKKEE